MFILEGSAGQSEDRLHGPTEDDAGRWAYSSMFLGPVKWLLWKLYWYEVFCVYIYIYMDIA